VATFQIQREKYENGIFIKLGGCNLQANAFAVIKTNSILINV